MLHTAPRCGYPSRWIIGLPAIFKGRHTSPTIRVHDTKPHGWRVEDSAKSSLFVATPLEPGHARTKCWADAVSHRELAFPVDRRNTRYLFLGAGSPTRAASRASVSNPTRLGWLEGHGGPPRPADAGRPKACQSGRVVLWSVQRCLARPRGDGDRKIVGVGLRRGLVEKAISGQNRGRVEGRSITAWHDRLPHGRYLRPAS